MFAITSSPAKQSVGDTITTLSTRLTSATLLEDRRAAILGLRSFAKDYPASVASDSLRALIGSLRKDGEDVDTIKIVLETLLMLFKPNVQSAEASEEIALWLADEFTQWQDNITLLLDFLDTHDFYSRLYALQLLSEIQSSRPARTEECVFTAPLGISRLVSVLDDKREAVRNEALSLLTFLTPTSSELQKLVAFENAFDRLFDVIKAEGSLLHGDRVVEDCLILLANLLRLNVSNQSYFRETGGVAKLARLLDDALSPDANEDVADWVLVQRNRNVYALLAIVRLMLNSASIATNANQSAFWQHGIVLQVLELAFDMTTELQIRAEALGTCADMIRGNPGIQEGFAQLQVPSVLAEKPTPGTTKSQTNGLQKVYVIDGLLDLTLSVTSNLAFDSRLAACTCIKSYFQNHALIRRHFLQRAIEGHASGADETANILTTLMQSTTPKNLHDPYRYWFATVLLYHLIFDDSEAKAMAMAVADGDSTNGEEIVTCIQFTTERLLSGIKGSIDERILIGSLMLLCGWLFEEPDAVNDFLGEGSNLQSLVEVILRKDGDAVVQGLCVVLLGIIYEFSTKDSPIARSQIHSILASRLGRDQYVDRLTKLRSHSLLRDFEVLPQQRDSTFSSTLPDIYFDQGFVDFLKDNYRRILRAIDREPGIEVPVLANGVQKGISRELVDSLKSQLEEKAKASQTLQDEVISLGRQLGQEQADHRRTTEIAKIDSSKLKSAHEASDRARLEEIANLRAELARLKVEHQQQVTQMQRSSDDLVHSIRKRAATEAADLQTQLSKLENDLEKVNKDHVQDLQQANEESKDAQASLLSRLQIEETRAKEETTRTDTYVQRAKQAEEDLYGKEKERQATQTELEELLLVFEDLENKVKVYRGRLRKAGEAISDGEDDEDLGEDDKASADDNDE